MEPPTSPLTPLNFLLRAAQVWSEREAVRARDTSLSFAEFFKRVEMVRGALDTQDVAHGARVATILPNVPELLELQYAVPGAGAVLVPINTRLAANEWCYILRHSGTRLVVAHHTVLTKLSEALDRIDPVPTVIVVGEDYSHWVAAATSMPLVTPDETDLLSINYTSGTTGPPKGVMYSHRGSYLHTLGVIAHSGLTPRSRYLWTLPMSQSHGWSYVWAVTAMGASHVCLGTFEPEATWDSLRDEGITHLCGTPDLLAALAESPAARPSTQLVNVFVGGAAPTPELIERIESLGMEVTQLYGLTESYGPIAICDRQPEWDTLSLPEQARLRSRQGVATVVSEPLRVVDGALRDVPADGQAIGEIVMRGNNVMLGYFRDSDATARAFAGGFLHTGDLGVMHPDGNIELRDRIEDIVISGGESLSTIEIEQALLADPNVIEAAVIGVPDERWGEVPKAFVVAREARETTPEQLQRRVYSQLARSKVPRLIEFRRDLPTTATGGVQKFLLR